MKAFRMVLRNSILAVLVALLPTLSFAEIEKGIVKIEGGMQCSL
jgi:hypothetical protein